MGDIKRRLSMLGKVGDPMRITPNFKYRRDYDCLPDPRNRQKLSAKAKRSISQKRSDQNARPVSLDPAPWETD